ncbi:hypothetical protein KUW09_07285 [Mameliella alba]|nr:hypothetical protein [Antarctobacter heliothermus]MBY6143837.1 hypothetical protein [Mameliella alba]MCA0953887.1 hypothetical protein [Mameliella alba]
MTLKKLCGYDVNGWRDFAARNWRIVPGEEEHIGELFLAECGPLSTIVNVGEGASDQWVGGSQADKAPHGLGGGWGEVGREVRRKRVHDILGGEQPKLMAAAFRSLSHGAGYNVASIDDVPDTTETRREAILRGLSAARMRNPMLVWRPVLVGLQAIADGQIATEQTIGVICHAVEGISVQRLRVRRSSGKSRAVLTPERRHSATLVRGEIGYINLERNARLTTLNGESYSARNAYRALARTVGQAALGLPCKPEILRKPNGDWEEIDLSGHVPPSRPGYEGALPNLSDCEQVFLETLGDGPVAAALKASLSDTYQDLVPMPADTVALGALEAARRMSEGFPVYFDFLPRLSTIVHGARGAANFDLIDASETLEAGRLYRSPQPATFGIPAGHAEISIYLNKEAASHPRKARVGLDTELEETTPVSLWVEQKPAAGRARITLDAPKLARQFVVDWDAATEDPRTWDDIIAEFDIPPPSVPNRLNLKCGMRAWEDSPRGPGLRSLLESETQARNVDWKSLADKLSARPFGEYCISSDGDLPQDVTDVDEKRLISLTEQAVEVTQARLDGKIYPGGEDNEALRFLTWQFRRSPKIVSTWLGTCISSREDVDFSHPFVRHNASWVLVYHGAARVAPDPEHETKLMKLLLDTDLSSWNWRQQTAGMALLLSRSKSAPLALQGSDVELLLERALADCRNSIGSTYTTFLYAPFLLAGLLRYRLKEPRAFVLGLDPLAEAVAKVIEAVTADLRRRQSGSAHFLRAREKYLKILDDLQSELEGRGQNPDLLLDLYR